MLSSLTTFAGDLKRSFIDLSIIVLVIALFQLVVLREVPFDWVTILFGIFIVGVGLALFMRGLETGVFPLGQELAISFASRSRRLVVIVFALLTGFVTTYAEPAVIVIADTAVSVSNGMLSSVDLRIVTALAVGVAIAIGALRLFLKHPIHWYILSGYAVVLSLTPFAPEYIVGIAYDMGGVATSTMTVPLIAALGIGLSTALKSKHPLIDGFGMIALASLVPMIFVLLYGMFIAHTGAPIFTHTSVFSEATFSSFGIAAGLFSAFLAVVPIFLVMLIFAYAVIRKKIEKLSVRAWGFFLTSVGLYLFVEGLEWGLFPIGESISISLAETKNVLLLYLYAGVIGFATTVAEPTLTAIARKAEEVSGGAIRSMTLRLFVAFGVGVGIALGTYRIIQGDPLVLYILFGYLLVVFLTFFAPRSIIPIAYDAGAVTTSTVTIPIIASLGLGLASTIPNRDPLIDGFGLIALASLFPILVALSYGIFKEERIRRNERYVHTLESAGIKNALKNSVSIENQMREARLRKAIITISGIPGSGASAVSKRVAQLLQFQYYSSGEMFKEIAKERGMSIADLNNEARKEGHLDREIDAIVRILGNSEKLVINARLGHYWLHHSFKVHLEVPLEVASERVYSLWKKEGRVPPDVSIEEVRTDIETQIRAERVRYLEHYGIDIGNMNVFDLVIDTTKEDVDSLAHHIVAEYTHWIGKRPLFPKIVS